MTVRELARHLSYSPGYVANVMYSLRAAGYVVQSGRRRRLGRGRPAVVWAAVKLPADNAPLSPGKTG